LILTLDNSSLTLLINPGANPPVDPATGTPLKYAKERVEGLVEGLTAQDRLIIPTPVLAEVMVEAGEGAPEIIDKLQTLARIQILPFDTRAAVELAVMTREAIQAGSKKGSSSAPWNKVKFDRQIIAISRVASADAIYSDDEEFCKFAQSVGMATRSTWELPVPQRTAGLFDGLDGD